MEAARSVGQTTVGPKLRLAREGRGLSIDDVAQALRLSPRIVSALEEDAYDRLPGATYVRGYLRNYAQFLGLSPQPLVDAYNDSPQASQRTDMTSLTPVRQITSSDMLVRLGTVAVAVIVFGLAALWWSSHETASLNPLVPPPAAPQSVPSDSSALEAEPGTTADTEEPAPVPPASEPAEAAKPSAAPAEAPATSSPSATATSTTPQPEPSTAAAATATTASPAPDTNQPLARLVLYVHDDSWADVRDAQQRRLLYETIPAGRVVTVEGAAPLSVFLGNVEGVTVEFNGKVYDAMRHKRGQVARFTLGSPQG